MGKLYTGSIDVSKIDKTRLFKSDTTGKTYLNVSIWINDETDSFGNNMSIQQTTKKDETKIFLGNAKEFKRENPNQQAPQEPILSNEDGLPLPF